jgi:hypothetical protein
MSNFLIDEDTGLLAAEFVLGTLDSAERANAQSMLKSDHGFIAMVRIWERRFGDLHLMVEPVDPDAKIFERIKAKLPVTAGEGAAAPAPDAQKAAAAPPSDEPPKPPEAIAASPVSASTAETPKPPEPGPTADAPKPPSAAPANERTIAPALTLPPAADLPVPRPPEEKAKTERAPLAENGAVPVPPPQPPASLKLPDKPLQDRRGVQRSEVVGVLRSRRRWRAFGIFMILVVFAMGGLVAAWRIAPDRLPARLRPSAVMMALGLQGGPTTPVPERKEAPPESQFDE